MTVDSPALENLTRRILAFEVAQAQAANMEVDEAERACAKLQLTISRLTGPAGFSSLLSRALVLAKAKAPSLEALHVRPDGSLAGFGEGRQTRGAGELAGDRVILVANLLGLLATFVGESLTLRLVLDSWPDGSIDPSGSERGNHA